MGGSLSSRIYISPDDPKNVVNFNLRSFSLTGSYSFAATGGTFNVPLGLGVKAIELGDAVQLAKLGQDSAVEIPVIVERKRKVHAAYCLDSPQVLANLMGGGGIVIALQNQEGRWVPVGVVDSDLGTLLVFGRVASHLRMILRLETKPASGWLDRGGTFLVGRVEGLVRCFLRLRFETEADRQSARAKETSVQFLTLAALISLALFMYGRRK